MRHLVFMNEGLRVSGHLPKQPLKICFVFELDLYLVLPFDAFDLYRSAERISERTRHGLIRFRRLLLLFFALLFFFAETEGGALKGVGGFEAMSDKKMKNLIYAVLFAGIFAIPVWAYGLEVENVIYCFIYIMLIVVITDTLKNSLRNCCKITCTFA